MYIFSFCFLIIFISISISIKLSCCYEKESYLEENFIDNVSYIEPEKVHIFMAFDNKYGEKLGNNTAKINKLYAEKYGFHFHKTNPDTNGLPPHFKRYFALKELMPNFPEDHIFIYVDGDASFLNHFIDIRKWIPKNVTTNILFSHEFNESLEDRFTSSKRNLTHGISFNSGVFIVKNNDWSKEYINNITKNCYDKMGDYGFKDQSCIGRLYLENLFNELKCIKVIPSKFKIQTLDINNKNIPIIHTAGKLNDNYYSTIEPTLSPI